MSAPSAGSVVPGIQSDVDLQYIQFVPSRLPVQLVMRIRQIRPICRTAVGKALLSRQPDQVITGIVRRINARETDERITYLNKPCCAWHQRRRFLPSRRGTCEGEPNGSEDRQKCILLAPPSSKR